MATSNFDALARDLYASLNSKANALVGKTNNVTLQPLNLGGAGYFPWFYEDSNNNFNFNTFLFLNRRVKPDGNGSLTFGDPLDMAYRTVLQDISFQLSSSDSAALNRANTNASGAMSSVVNGYQTTYGPITPAQMTAANVSTKIDYVISYKVGQVWSGRTTTPPLTWSEMINAANLSSLLPNLPPSASPLLNSIANYLSAVSGVISLQDAVSNNNWLRTHLLNNTIAPTALNGGAGTVHNDGTVDMEVAFTVNQSEQSLNQSLGNAGNVLELNMTAAQADSSTYQVSVEGHGGISVPIDFMVLNMSGGSSFNLSSINGSSKSISIKATFPGLSFVSFSPELFQQAVGKGWYLADIIKQAVVNGSQDVSGFRFSPKPSYDFSKNGDFGILNALAISQFPTIEVNYMQGDYSQFQQTFQEHTKWDLKFLGLCPVGGGSQSVYESTSSANASGGGFTIKFSPPANNYIDPSGVTNSNMAFVLGGQATYPGA